jgi:hypothetical protein
MPRTRCLLAGLLLLGATGAEAQVRLHGRVIDDASSEAVAGASVVMQDARGRAVARQLTDELGQFSFTAQGAGPVRLVAERIGFRRTVTPPLSLEGYTLFRVEVRVAAEAVVLAPLEVVSRSRTDRGPTLAGFDERRTMGTGWFVTREEIESQRPSRVTDLLATAPGVAMQSGGVGGRRTVYMSRSGHCPAQIFVDGFHVNRPTRQAVGGRRGASTTEAFPIDDLVQPGSIEGIEVYQGLSRIPPEFRTLDVACGVVAIWTRRGA